MVGNDRMRSANCAAEPAEGLLLHFGSTVDQAAEHYKEHDHDWNREKKHQSGFPGHKGDSCCGEQGTDAQHVLCRAVADDEAGECVGIALQAGNQGPGGFGADARAATFVTALLSMRFAAG